MSKIVPLNDVVFTNVTQAATDTATNNTRIENALQNTVSRDGSSPNQMEADFDMNSNHILNLPCPETSLEPIRRIDFENGFIGETCWGFTVPDLTPPAEDVTFVPNDCTDATNVQDAIDALCDDIGAVQDALLEHIDDPTNAHPASAISTTTNDCSAATNVQDMLDDLCDELSALEDDVDALQTSAATVTCFLSIVVPDVQAAVDIMGTAWKLVNNSPVAMTVTATSTAFVSGTCSIVVVDSSVGVGEDLDITVTNTDAIGMTVTITYTRPL